MIRAAYCSCVLLRGLQSNKSNVPYWTLFSSDMIDEKFPFLKKSDDFFWRKFCPVEFVSGENIRLKFLYLLCTFKMCYSVHSPVCCTEKTALQKVKHNFQS